AAFYEVPIAPRPGAYLVEAAAGADRVSTLVEALPELAGLAGATLEWWALKDSHGHFRLLASREGSELVEVRLIDTNFVHLPRVAHNIRFRLATQAETESLRAEIPARRAGELRREKHLVIESDEGVFSV